MSHPPELIEAIRLQKAGQLEQSRQILRAFLQRDPANVDALLWLAKVSPDEREALAAAELAFALQPENEIAQRAVAVVAQRLAGNSPPPALDVMRVTGMTVAQARAVNWPFKGHNRPIGVLLDEGAIGLNDLGFAVQKAYDAQLKRAANTLLLQHLLGEGLKEPLPSLKIVSGRSHAARNERLATFGFGILMGFALLILLGYAAFVAFYIYSLATGAIFRPLFSVLSCVALLILVPAGYGVTGLAEYLLKQVESYRAGANGERRTSEALQASLRSPWTLFRNVEWPHRRWGDADLILIGPSGVWTFEVKAYTGPVRNIGDNWQYKGRWGWRNVSRHPGQQARRNAVNTKNYLELHGAAPGYVQAVVIWAGEPETVTIEDPAVPVWRLSELSESLEELWQREKLSPEQIEKCCAILAEVIAQDEARIAAEEAKDKKHS